MKEVNSNLKLKQSINFCILVYVLGEKHGINGTIIAANKIHTYIHTKIHVSQEG
jgi:hypothetical protein